MIHHAITEPTKIYMKDGICRISISYAEFREESYIVMSFHKSNIVLAVGPKQTLTKLARDYEAICSIEFECRTSDVRSRSMLQSSKVARRATVHKVVETT